jgi:hypothetical protein
MNIPGEKFELDFDDLQDDSYPQAPPPMNFVSDIVEKTSTTAPVAPVFTPSSGFPSHKKRIPKNPSRFKQRAQAASQAPQEDTRTDKQRISDDNAARVAAMSPEQIEEERNELLSKLSPNLIEKLLKRANLDDPVHSSASKPQPPVPTVEDESAPEPKPIPRPVGERPDAIPKPPQKSNQKKDPVHDIDDAAPPIYDPALFPSADKYHFPVPPQPDAKLDPSSPDFQQSLHQKYFPDLPSDPSKLAWMAPVKEDFDYHPDQEDLLPSALRFDFRGEILPPRKARELPTHLGLHHHAEAPNAAGYTIPELARLARSTFPTQRCMAMQVLGRILYRLGMGSYKVQEITNGLWRCVEEGRVVEGLEEAAAAKGGHMSVKAYATEALWLWQKGGGKRMQAQ